MRSKAITFIAAVLFIVTPAAMGATAPLDVTAKSAIVIEAATGKVLYEKNANDRRYPASTTKIMTLITALETGNMNDIVTASKAASTTEGSSLWLTEGESLSMLDMSYGMMLVSGNDATVAIAEHIAGSVPAFAQLMTDKAQAIGATHTHFTNSSGLPDVNHYTTAADMAKITAYGYQLPLFATIVSTKEKIMPWQGQQHPRDLFNENRMLWLYDGANGAKTGYTEDAGRCLVSAAKRDGVQLIAVVFDSERMWDDSIAMLNYSFKQIHSQPIIQQGDILKTVKVVDGKDKAVLPLYAQDGVVIPVSGDDEGDFTTVMDVPDKVNAPIEEGQTVGQIKVLYQNKEVGSTNLVAHDSVEKKSLFKSLWSSVQSLVSYMLRNFA
jgi:serine-type D-Ala-D-Ala carboxypeptidase (penicillin-binding protein 5/6)